MASKPLRLHPLAEQEYLTSLGWYRERSFTAAENFAAAFDQAIEKVSRSPRRWPAFFSNFRKYTLKQFPFSIIYEDCGSEVIIFAVAHARRRPGYWTNRV